MKPIGLATSVKWAALKRNARDREIRNRLKGGGRNPHARLIRLLVNYCRGDLTRNQVLERIDSMADGWLQRVTRRGFDNFVALVGTKVPSLLPSPTWEVAGPTGRLTIAASPHMTIRVNSEVWHVCVWNNEKPEIDFSVGSFGPAMMLEAANDDCSDSDAFVLLNLKDGRVYSLRAGDRKVPRRRALETLRTLDAAVKKVEDE